MAGRPKELGKASAGSTGPGARGLTRGQDTRTGLLEAAERILLQEGIQALTVRRIGVVSDLNPTLVTYHFGTVAGLLAELCRLNLEPMLADWEVLSDGSRTFATAREVLEAWMVPLMRPAAFTHDGRTLTLLDEIASHGEKELRDQLLEAMLRISAIVQAALKPFTPHLDARELWARVRFLSAATLGPPPRSRVVRQAGQKEPLDGSGYLLAFAEAALGIGSDDATKAVDARKAKRGGARPSGTPPAARSRTISQGRGPAATAAGSRSKA